MSDLRSSPATPSAATTVSDRLDSWKEIAAYLNRDVSTVQRWEKKEGLPVHRLLHDKLGSVFASKLELDAWWNRGRQRIEAAESAPGWGRSRKTLVAWPELSREMLRAGTASLRASWRLVLAVGVMLLMAFGAGALVTWRAGSGGSRAPVHLSIPLPPGTTLAVEGDTDPAIAISRDGTKLAYVVRQGSRKQIYVRALDRPEAAAVLGTDGARSPFFSPDGQSLGFASDLKLKTVSFATGKVVAHCEVGYIRGATWGSDDTIVFAWSNISELWRVSARGGPCERLTTREQDEHSHRLPSFLPDGKTLLFTVGAPRMGSWDDAQIDLSNVATGTRRRVVEGGTNARYAPSGHLVYARRGSLFAVGFDLRAGQAIGNPVEVMGGVVTSPTGSEAHFTLSESGVLAYAPGLPWGMQHRLVWVDREGSQAPISEHRGSFASVRLSPDGRYVAVETDELRTDLWVYDLTRGTFTRLTSEGLYNQLPVWTPDGRYLTYHSNAKSPGRSLFWRPVDGSAPPEQLSVVEDPQGRHNPWSWSPDGEVLAFVVTSPDASSDIWLLRRRDRKLQPLLAGPFNERMPAFSPDGRWLAYVSNESGRPEVYVRPFPGAGPRWQISTNGGQLPRWARDTGELFYREGPKMLAVTVVTSPPFSASKPRLLFEKTAVLDEFDVTADGARFVMIDKSEEPAPTQINVVVNWHEELKRKVPTGR